MGWGLDALYALTLLPHYGWHRCVSGKYGPDAPQKLGRVPLRDGDAPGLWLHAVSVGETVAARTLADGFAARHPDWDLRVSTTTATGRAVAQKRFGDDRVVYYPLDLSWMVRRAFDRLRPSLLVLMELEVWPHLLEEAQRRSVPVVVSNVRITDRSVRGFRRFGGLARRMLGRVSLWLAQSEDYARRLQSLGVNEDKICVVGSLKYDQVPTVMDDDGRARYRTLLGVEDDMPVLIAGSTHPGEEDMVLDAYSRLRAQGHESLRLVLVPRHPERLDAVETLAAKVAPVVRRSALNETAPARDPIVLVDTMGELAKLYAAADVVVQGGTFSPAVGGHNMMEPCGLARPTVIGPHVQNFAEPAQVLQAADGVRTVADGDALTSALQALLADPADAAALGARGRAALIERQGATARSMERIDAVLAASDRSPA